MQNTSSWKGFGNPSQIFGARETSPNIPIYPYKLHAYGPIIQILNLK